MSEDAKIISLTEYREQKFLKKMRRQSSYSVEAMLRILNELQGEKNETSRPTNN